MANDRLLRRVFTGYQTKAIFFKRHINALGSRWVYRVFSMFSFVKQPDTRTIGTSRLQATAPARELFLLRFENHWVEEAPNRTRPRGRISRTPGRYVVRTYCRRCPSRDFTLPRFGFNYRDTGVDDLSLFLSFSLVLSVCLDSSIK